MNCPKCKGKSTVKDSAFNEDDNEYYRKRKFPLHTSSASLTKIKKTKFQLANFLLETSQTHLINLVCLMEFCVWQQLCTLAFQK